MLRSILLYGVLAGLIVIVPLASLLVWEPSPEATTSSQFFGYTLMVVALSMIFLGVKRYRDRELGGVIRFLPAFLMGLGISAVAGVIYVIVWEITLQMTDFGWMTTYAEGMIERARTQGKTVAEVEKIAAEMAKFQVQYRNPFFRLPVTFVEIFPVGVVISLVTALLLRNSRFMPARAGATA